MKAALLLFTALTIPVHAGTISLDVTGTLGPLLFGTDPLQLSGQTFEASGSFSQDLVPVDTTDDSAAYALPVNLQIMVGALVFTGYDPLLTVVVPSSGPDSVSLSFSVLPAQFSPDVYAFLSLPAGTLVNTGLQDFSVAVSQPDSNLFYTIFGNSQSLAGELGMTGTAALTGASGASAPEPGTIGLLAAGLIALGCTARKFRAH